METLWVRVEVGVTAAGDVSVTLQVKLPVGDPRKVRHLHGNLRLFFRQPVHSLWRQTPQEEV